MQEKLKAVLIDEFGPSKNLRIGSVDVPSPGPGQVLIRTAYASVNPADWKIRSGMLPLMQGESFPVILGMDLSGVIAAVGSGVDDFKVGDRVAALTSVGLDDGAKGSYAEYCCTSAVRVVHIPDHVTLEEAATIPTAAASGGGAIVDIAKVKAGDAVFFHGGSGSLGTFAVQFLKTLGAKVAATCSTAHIERLGEFGVDRVIDYTREDVLAAVAAWAPHGVDAIIDAVGLNSLPRNAPDVIRDGGVLVFIQNLITDENAFDIEGAAKRNIRIIDNVFGTPNVGTHMFQVEGFRQIAAGVARGDIKVPPYKVVPIEDVALAHDEVEEGHFRHKILLKMSGSQF